MLQQQLNKQNMLSQTIDVIDEQRSQKSTFITSRPLTKLRQGRTKANNFPTSRSSSKERGLVELLGAFPEVTLFCTTGQLIIDQYVYLQYLSLNMSFSKNWSPEEDQALLNLYTDRNFRKWTQISHLLQKQYGIKGKTPKKCRERFKNHLDPNINKQQWTPQEEKTLMTLQTILGNKWAQISRLIPGRTDDSIKNKFCSKYRKAIRNINSLRSKFKNSKLKQLKIGFVYKLINFIDNSRKKTTSTSEELLTLAENLKKNIIGFQDIDSEKHETRGEELSDLADKIQQFSAQLKSKSANRRGRKASNLNRMSQAINQSPRIKTAFPQKHPAAVDSTPKKEERPLDFNIGMSRIHIFSPFALPHRYDEEQLLKQEEYDKVFLRRQQHSDSQFEVWKTPIYGISHNHQYLD